MAKAKANCFAPQVLSDQTFDETPDVVLCPVEVEHVWDWYVELDSTRNSGFDIGPVTFAEIESWSRLMKIEVSPFEVQSLRAIDKAYIKFQRSKRDK